NVLRPLWAAMTLDIRAARIDCPASLSNLAADKVFVRGLAGANSNVGLTLGEIEIVITHHQLDPQTGMPCLERIDQGRPGQPMCNGGRACQAKCAGQLFLARSQAALERRHCSLDAFCIVVARRARSVDSRRDDAR